MKRTLLLFLILIPIWLLAQDMPFSVKSETKYGASTMVGQVVVDSVKYSEVRVIPEFKIWKFGIGLDLDFLFDKDHHLKKSDWDRLDDIPNKFYYVKFADYGDPFYARVGGFPNHTLGNGLIMLNYSNMMLYPDLRNTGLMIGGNPYWPTKPSFEAFTSNVQKNQILAFSAHCQPLPDSTVRVLDKLVIGLSAVTDRNEYGNLKYVVIDSLYNQFDHDKKNVVTAMSYDYSLPLFEKKNVDIGNYAEYAHISGNGSGFIFPAFYSNFKFLKLNLEWRTYQAKFLPAFFDHHYEEQRAFQITDPNADSLFQIVTKEQTLQPIKKSHGWYGKVQTNIYGKIKAMVAWQDMYGKDLTTGKSLWIRFWADTQYHRLENISLSFSETNVDYLGFHNIITPTTDMATKITFRVSKKRLFLIGAYSESYIDRNENNKINWSKETKRSVAVGVKYIWN